MSRTVLPCPFCEGEPAPLDENDHTSCTNIACGSTAYMHVDSWNERPALNAGDVPLHRDRLLQDNEDYRKGYFDGYADAYGDVSDLKAKLTERRQSIGSAPKSKEQVVPEDIMRTATEVVERIGTTHIWKGDCVADVALAMLAERERCAVVADWYSQASVHAEWTDEARGAGYYACADVARDIRFPKPVKEPSPQAFDADDDLPF